MKKFHLVFYFLLITVVFFIGCTKKEVFEDNYTYKGDNELWDAEYNVDCTVTFTEKNGKHESNSKANYELIVTYKGELSDLSSVRKIVISYKTSNSREEMERNFGTGESIQSKTFTLSSSGKNNALPIENDIIEVTINIDGDIQTLELINVNTIS